MTEQENQLIESLNKQVQAMINGQLSSVEWNSLNDEFTDSLKKLTESINQLAKKQMESKNFILSLASGKLEQTPPKNNNLIAPFKQLHADLLHLNWQTQEIVKGDYNQKVSFMGDFSNSFNQMIQSLKEKKKLEDSLIESNATKDKFFSIIAHDLKGPLSTMMGFSNLLVEKFESFNTQKQKEYLGVLNSNIKNTYKLLENLLLWSRSHRGTIDFSPEKQNLYLLLDGTICLLNQSAVIKSISIENNVPKNIYVWADKNMLLTILRNLISNAIKYTTKGGKITINTHIIENENQNTIEISIEDNGTGIAKERIDKLFKISENISTNGTEGEKGTGLGLILCKEFVEKHQGHIWVESIEGEGSKFFFSLPYIS